MKIPVTDLVRAVSAIDLIPSRAGISSSEFIRVQTTAKGLSFALAAEIYGCTRATAIDPSPTPWSFFVDRTSFVPFVQIAEVLKQKSPFEFRYTDKGQRKLVIQCGRRKAVFQTVTEVSGYGDKMPVKGARLTLTLEQKSMLQLAVRYATQDPTQAHLNCVYLKKGAAIISCNQVAAFYMRDSVVPMSVPLPILLLNIISDKQVTSIEVSDKFAQVHLSCGFLCQLTNKKAATEFPGARIVKNIANAEAYPKQFVLSSKSLIAVLSRLEAYIATVVKRDIVVHVIGKKGSARLRLVAAVPQGSFEESVRILHPLKQDVDCMWLMNLLLPLSALVDVLGNLAVHYSDKTPYLFKAKGLRLLIARKS